MRSCRALVLLVLGLLLNGRGAAAAEELFSREDNYNIALPTGWTKMQPSGTWEKDGIKVGARRVLEKLEDGKPAQGQGAQMHLSRVAAPEGKSLADLAADPLQREFLLRYFGKPETWPKVEVEETKVKGEGEAEVPALRLSVEGKGINPVSQNEDTCYGQLLLVVAKKHLLRLRLIAWTTPGDEEGLHWDLDRLGLDFQLVDATTEKPKEQRPKEEGGDAAGEPAPEGDSGEEKQVANAQQGWRFTKPKGLATRPLDKVKSPYTEAAVGGNDRGGYGEMVLSLYPNGLVVDGRQQAPQDIRKWCTLSLWQQFLALCPAGAVDTFPWPKQKPGATFLTVPDLEKPEVLLAADKKRPAELDESDLLKKLKIAEEAKGTVGEQKVSEAYRAVIRGNRKDVGPEVTLRFAWRTPKFTYMLSATVGREGAKKYGALLKTLLESFEIAK